MDKGSVRVKLVEVEKLLFAYRHGERLCIVAVVAITMARIDNKFERIVDIQ